MTKDTARRGPPRGLPAGITLRVLSDGTQRFDVRYRLANGKPRKRTFEGITAAKDFLATTRADKARGGLVDPQRGKVTLRTYASSWIDTRADLRPRTAELYRSLLRLHIEPDLGAIPLAKIHPELVRRWHRDLLAAGVGPTTVAKAYRLLRTVLNSAVADGRILSNSCQIKNGGAEPTTERPVVDPATILALAAEVSPHRSALVVLAGFCGLRLGEALGLAVRHVDLIQGELVIERQLQEIPPNNEQRFTLPKSEASRRRILLPATVADSLSEHIDRIEQPDPDTLLFTGAKGNPLRRHVWHNEWDQARTSLGLPALRYHDLRHSALTLYAGAGATLAELQAHGGHSTVQAALRYQHASSDRASALASIMDRAIEGTSGTAPVSFTE